MKRLLFLTFLIFIFQNAQAENQRLSEAYENEIVERVKGIFQTKGIEEKAERPICATPIFLEIKANWDRFSPKTKSILESYTKRITYNFPESTYNTPQGHFKIHYVTQGDSAVPDEGWIHTCGEVLEHVWDTETGVLGYNPPPGDSLNPDTSDNGGDGRYDVYLVDLSIYYLGYTQGEYFISSQSLSATSYIVLDNDYTSYGSLHSPIEWLQVTFAHEFFHAIQMGYDATEYERENEHAKPYWMEMSAVWMEDMVYDDVNDYLGYLKSFFDHPEWSLKTFGSNPFTDEGRHPYGSCVWPIYLSEKFGRDIIKEIWEKCAEKDSDNALEATDAVLRTGARGSTLEDAFREFTVWNYLTGDRARTQLFYSEGDLFPMMKVEDLHSHNSDTVDSPSGPNHPYGLGSNYIVFKPTDKQGGIKLAFSPADAKYDFQISALGYNKDVNEPVMQQFQINHQTGYAETDVYNWTDYNQIIMIPAATSRNENLFFPYTYSAKYDSSFHGEHLLPQKDFVGQNFPNPFVISGNSDSTYFPFILSSLGDVEINVFTISGEMVWRYKEQEKTIGNYTQYPKCPGWNGKNQKGEYVASGIYLYQVKTKNANVVKKMAVIR